MEIQEYKDAYTWPGLTDPELGLRYCFSFLLPYNKNIGRAKLGLNCQMSTEHIKNVTHSIYFLRDAFASQELGLYYIDENLPDWQETSYSIITLEI